MLVNRLKASSLLANVSEQQDRFTEIARNAEHCINYQIACGADTEATKELLNDDDDLGMTPEEEQEAYAMAHMYPRNAKMMRL